MMGHITQKHLPISFASLKHTCQRPEVGDLSFLLSCFPSISLLTYARGRIWGGFGQARPHLNKKDEDERNPTPK